MRRLLLVCVAFSGAVFAAQLFSWTVWPLVAASACLACGIVLALVLRGNARVRAALLTAGLMAGFFWSYGYSLLFYAQAKALDGQFAALTATVLTYPRETPYGYAVTARSDLPGHVPVKTLFYLPAQYGALQPGDRISALSETRDAGWSRSGEVSYLIADGVFLVAITKGEVAVESGGSPPLAALPAVWGRQLQSVFYSVFPADTGGLVSAILTGDTDNLTSLDSALRRTGLAHAVSVSGMHISFLAGLISLLLGGHNRRAALVAIPLILLFTLAVGAPPAAVRAAVMYIILLLAPLLRRENDTPTTLCFSLALLLAQNPYAAANIGLQLSFAATAGIVLLSGRLQEGMTAKLPDFGNMRFGRLCAGLCRSVLSVLAVTLGAIAFTAPLTALYFNAVSLVSPLASLVTMWAVSAAFLGGLAAGLLGMIWLPLGQGLAFLVSPVVHYLLWVIPALSGLPLAAVTMRSVFYRGWLLLTYVLVGITTAFKGWKRPLIPVCCSVAALLCAAVFTRLSYRAGPLTVTALDVGQGQSIVLLADGYTAMVDCGGFSNSGDIAASYLQDAGIDTVDVLVLTHYHADHANGVDELMRRLTVSSLVLPDVTPDDALRREILALAEQVGTQVVFADAPSKISLGSAALTVFPPLAAGDANEEGLTVLGTAGDFDVLITGDMNSSVEAILVAQYALPDIELLVAGHHGSKYSTSASFLDAVTPEYAFISVSISNTYGHPTPETLTRLDDAGVEIYRTDLMGTVSLTVNTP